MKERASLAGASGWLRLFNALINPLLKAMQRVSGFVLWPCDYSAINKGWAGNIDEIPPPLLCSALWLFSNMAWDRDDMQLKICERKSCWYTWVSVWDEHFKFHVQNVLHVSGYNRSEQHENSQYTWLSNHIIQTYTGAIGPIKSIQPLGILFLRFKSLIIDYFLCLSFCPWKQIKILSIISHRPIQITYFIHLRVQNLNTFNLLYYHIWQSVIC